MAELPLTQPEERYRQEPDDNEKFNAKGYTPHRDSMIERPYKIRKSIVILIWQLLIVVVLFAAFQLGLGRVLALLSIEDRSIGLISVMELKSLVMLGLNIIVIIHIMLKWAYQYYLISSKEFSKHEGIIHRRTWTVDIASIQVLRVSQGILGRIFGYGSINMEIKLLDYDMHMRDIPKPQMYASIIEHYKTGGNIDDAK